MQIFNHDMKYKKKYLEDTVFKETLLSEHHIHNFIHRSN